MKYLSIYYIKCTVGHTFYCGGAVKGGKVYGKYPKYLNSTEPLNIGRGRMIPTTSWETFLHGILEWFGVEEKHMKDVLPNIEKFSELWDSKTLYE